MTKNLTFMTDILCQIQILLLNILELLKVPGFLFKITGFFSKSLKFQVFPGIQVFWPP